MAGPETDNGILNPLDTREVNGVLTDEEIAQRLEQIEDEIRELEVEREILIGTKFEQIRAQRFSETPTISE